MPHGGEVDHTDHATTDDRTAADRPTPDAAAAAGRRRRRAGPLVVAEALTKSFDDREVIKSLDLRLERGTILGLIGPSGCGKTTTVRLMTGLLKPTPAARSRCSARRRRALHSVAARHDRLPAAVTGPVSRALACARTSTSTPRCTAFRCAAGGGSTTCSTGSSCVISSSTRVADASGGMQRRLALAATFVQDPVLAFLDEPTAGDRPHPSRPSSGSASGRWPRPASHGGHHAIRR